MAMLAAKGGESPLGGLAATVLAAASAVASVAMVAVWQASAGSFAVVGYHFDPTTPTSPLLDVARRDQRALRRARPLGVARHRGRGRPGPLGCAVLARRKGGKSWLALGAAGAACAVVGAVCLRVVFYELGLSVFMFY